MWGGGGPWYSHRLLYRIALICEMRREDLQYGGLRGYRYERQDNPRQDEATRRQDNEGENIFPSYELSLEEQEKGQNQDQDQPRPNPKSSEDKGKEKGKEKYKDKDQTKQRQRERPRHKTRQVLGAK